MAKFDKLATRPNRRVLAHTDLWLRGLGVLASAAAAFIIAMIYRAEQHAGPSMKLALYALAMVGFGLTSVGLALMGAGRGLFDESVPPSARHRLPKQGHRAAREGDDNGQHDSGNGQPNAPHAPRERRAA
jgi:hypothetical protein